MQQIIIVGRGGQGAQTAGNQLAEAFFAEGKYVQSFATYGGARRGTPVSSSIRIDEQPIQLRCNITRADAILCFDSSLLDAQLLQLADSQTWVVVNTGRPAQDFAHLGAYRIVPVNGLEIAARFNMGKVVNSALLGAFAGILGRPDFETLCEVVEQTVPGKKAENVAACRHACDLVRNVLLEEVVS